MPSELIDGPDQYWSDHVPPSRGQYRDLALLGLRLLGVEPPKSRLEATIAMVRLRAAIRDQTPPRWSTTAVVSAGIDVETARRALTMTVEEAHVYVEHAAEALSERRALRQRRGSHGKTPRCKQCNRFRSSTTGRCGCGYDQDRGWS